MKGVPLCFVTNRSTIYIPFIWFRLILILSKRIIVCCSPSEYRVYDCKNKTVHKTSNLVSWETLYIIIPVINWYMLYILLYVSYLTTNSSRLPLSFTPLSKLLCFKVNPLYSKTSDDMSSHGYQLWLCNILTSNDSDLKKIKNIYI